MTEYLVHTIQRSVVIQHASSVIEADSIKEAEAIAQSTDPEQEIEFEFGNVISEEVTNTVLNSRIPTKVFEDD